MTEISPTGRDVDGVRWLLQRWPSAAGILVAAGTVLGLSYGSQAASVVAASGFVYLAAAATGHRAMAWPAFGLTFVLVGMGISMPGFDAVIWISAAALALAVFGIFKVGWQPVWSLPLQTAAMLVLAGAALLAVNSNHVLGGFIVSGALFAHAAWDVWHHRTGRVVLASLSEFCCVLDVVAGAGILALTLTL
ncbi:hypothetical protein FB566_0183 [Stackebrandtia endophytica]|uniref:Uncharacterized protein n=1 Tax=Stackebrandtia endophytica TaxID=1496996 RepID=A0A543AQ31_9ACTN|nr:hypothetical protein [Stackebrandtia endophytica]TQL74697.1 hypothetical protein FB566_0183 [Stackebrandtia endophytica]